MIKLYLILNDIIVPVLVGFLTTSLFLFGDMTSYLVYSFLLVAFSFLKGFYNNYYSIHFSEKLRISFITGTTLIFFQLIYYSLNDIYINIAVFFSWILISVLIPNPTLAPLITHFSTGVLNKTSLISATIKRFLIDSSTTPN